MLGFNFFKNKSLYISDNYITLSNLQDMKDKIKLNSIDRIFLQPSQISLSFSGTYSSSILGGPKFVPIYTNNIQMTFESYRVVECSVFREDIDAINELKKIKTIKVVLI